MNHFLTCPMETGTERKETLILMMIILMVVVFVMAAGSEQIPMREEFEQIVLKAAVCGVAVPPITATQLPWLARVEASVSGGSVQVLLAQSSLGEGIADTLRSLSENTHLQQQTQRPPNYVLIIHTSAAAGASEFCIMVLGEQEAACRRNLTTFV